MTLDETMRALVRSEVRAVVREELAAAPQALPALAPSPREYMTVREAAEFACVAIVTVRKWLSSGRLTPHHAGRLVRVRVDELRRVLRPTLASLPDEGHENRRDVILSRVIHREGV